MHLGRNITRCPYCFLCQTFKWFGVFFSLRCLLLCMLHMIKLVRIYSFLHNIFMVCTMHTLVCFRWWKLLYEYTIQPNKLDNFTFWSQFCKVLYDLRNGVPQYHIQTVNLSLIWCIEKREIALYLFDRWINASR